jgi:hypothetical protein
MIITTNRVINCDSTTLQLTTAKTVLLGQVAPMDLDIKLYSPEMKRASKVAKVAVWTATIIAPLGDEYKH